MQLGQAVRRFSDQWRAMWAALREGVARMTPQGVRRAMPDTLLARAAIVIVCVLALYYGIGMLLMHNIDDDPGFTIDGENVLDGESESVAYASAVLSREVNSHGWVANDPFYLPTSLLWNMAAYQTGILSAVLQFTESLGQALTERGMGYNDLDAAALRLSRPGDVWRWGFSEPLGFLGRSENQYREGILALEGYNVAVADATTPFPRDVMLLIPLLAGFGQTLEETTKRLTDEARSSLVLFDTDISDAFYAAKGTAYAQYVIFKGIRTDFGAVLRARDAMAEFETVQNALRDAAELSPAFIANGRPDGALFASHPLTEGYFLLRAKDALDILVAKLRA